MKGELKVEEIAIPDPITRRPESHEGRIERMCLHTFVEPCNHVTDGEGKVGGNFSCMVTRVTR